MSSLLDALAQEIALENSNGVEKPIEQKIKAPNVWKFDNIASQKQKLKPLQRPEVQNEAHKCVKKSTADYNSLINIGIKVKNLFIKAEELSELVVANNVCHSWASLHKQKLSDISIIGVISDITDDLVSRKGHKFMKCKISKKNQTLDVLLFNESVQILLNSQFYSGVVVFVHDFKLHSDKKTLIVTSAKSFTMLGDAYVRFCSNKSCKNIVFSNNIKFCNLHLSEAITARRHSSPIYSGGLAYTRPRNNRISNQDIIKRLRRGDLRLAKADPVKNLNEAFNISERGKGIKRPPPKEENKTAKEWQSIKRQKSLFHKQAKDENYEKTMKKLKLFEEREAVAEKMEKLDTFKVKAFACFTCRLLLETRLDNCIEGNHRFKEIRATKRFFCCSQCNYKINTLNKKHPNQRCEKCRNEIWKKCSAYNTDRVIRG